MTTTKGEAAPATKPKRRIVGSTYPGSNAPRGRWPLAYKYLIFRIYEPYMGADGAAKNRAFAASLPTKTVIERIRFAAPDMYDWWMDTHPGANYTFDEWVKSKVFNRYYYMFTNVKTREAEVSTEHPSNWDICKNDTPEWHQIVAWVEDRLENGVPQEYHDELTAV